MKIISNLAIRPPCFLTGFGRISFGDAALKVEQLLDVGLERLEGGLFMPQPAYVLVECWCFLAARVDIFSSWE